MPCKQGDLSGIKPERYIVLFVCVCVCVRARACVCEYPPHRNGDSRYSDKFFKE